MGQEELIPIRFKTKKLTLILCGLFLYCISTTAQNILGSWKYDSCEITVKTNNDEATEVIIDYINKEISDYYENTIMEFYNNGLYDIDGKEAGSYEVDENKFIDIKPHKNRVDTAIFDITNEVLTLHMSPSKQGFFGLKKLKKLNIANPENLQIKEEGMLIHWRRQPKLSIPFAPPVITSDEDIEEDESEAPTVQLAPPAITQDEDIEDENNEDEQTYPQDIIGKWKVVKKNLDAVTDNKDVSKAILDEFNSFLDDSDAYIQFTENGEYMEYTLDTQIRTLTYKTNRNKIKVSGSTEFTYSVSKDQLEIVFDYSKFYLSDYLERMEIPVSKPVNIKKVELHTYLKKLPENYNIQDSLKSAMIRDSIIIVSKHPDRVKEDIIGKWKPFKTETIVVSNSKESTQALKNITEGLFSDHKSFNLVFDENNMIERYDSIPYSIDGNLLISKEKTPFSINDNILTIERDLKDALAWMGIWLGDNNRMLAIRKYAARTYYVKVTSEMYASLKKKSEELDIFIKNNIQYPPEAIAKKTEGTVFVFLKIEADGTISYARVNDEIDPLLDAEAIRIAKLLTPEWWEPAKENNIAISGYTGIPITFKLPEDK